MDDGLHLLGARARSHAPEVKLRGAEVAVVVGRERAVDAENPGLRRVQRLRGRVVDAVRRDYHLGQPNRPADRTTGVAVADAGQAAE